MRQFQDIYDIAAERKGGADAVEKEIGNLPLPPAELAKIPDDRWLSRMTRSVFQAGFNWKVIDAKWDGFEAAFKGFDVDACAFMPEPWFEELLTDTRIVRNGLKIRTIQDNATFLQSLRDQGGAGQVLGGWPSNDFIGLLDLLKTKGSRLGAMTGQYSMRFMRRDGFILSRDVTARLIAEGVIDKPATSKTAMRAVQDAFNTWSDQSGRSLLEVSRVLALSL